MALPYPTPWTTLLSNIFSLLLPQPVEDLQNGGYA